ncbi:MAG: hypothetical protein QOE35_1528 [Actinomycetota bacterium]|jgi:hypothetical protein
MGNPFQATACPLCHDSFEHPEEYRDHLAMIHDLVDDEGTQTKLTETPEPETEPEPAAGPAPAPSAVPVLVTSTPHVSAEPAAALTGSVDLRLDRRVLPGLVIAVAVQLVVALLGLAVVGGDGGAKNVATQSTANERARSTPAASGGAGAAASPSSTAPATTAPPATDTHSDQARADLIAPRTADFPSGWTQVNPAALGGSASDDTSALDVCTVPDDPTNDPSIPSTPVALEHAASFAFGGSMILKNEADALRGMTILRETSRCLGDAIAKDTASSTPRGVTVTHGTFSSLGFSTYGDETIAMSMPMSFVGPGAAVPVRVDLLAVRRDRAVVFLMAIVGANDFTPAQERTALSSIADRMAPKSI